MKPVTSKLTGLFRSLVALLLSAVTTPAAAQTHGHATPGADMSAKTRVLDAGAQLLQNNGPVGAIHAHVCGFHFYNGEIDRQVRSHHYCAHLNEDVMQCVIYDSDRKDARLIGVEYIISEKLFRTLPEEEKQLWHSHQHEVMSGQLIAPGLPDVAEKELMEKLVNTYGKTWHFWQVDRGDTLPLGTPKLMMGFTADGQVNEKLLAERNRQYGTDTEAKRRNRADLPAHAPEPRANAWQRGKVFQVEDVSPIPSHPKAQQQSSSGAKQ